MNTTKTTAPKPFCFVLMPFDSSFDDVYQIGIKESCDAAGSYCERVDEQIFNERILDRIYNQIAKADFVIADMTGRNPNVFYEVGYAHALGKPTILLTQRADDIPFDLKHFPHIVYENKLTHLRDQLTPRVKWHVENRIENASDTVTGIDIYLGPQNLASGEQICEFPEGLYPKLTITIFNSSSHTFEPGTLLIGLIPGEWIISCDFSTYGIRGDSLRKTLMPDGQGMYLFDGCPTPLPQAYETFDFVFLYRHDDKPTVGFERKIFIRVLTPRGANEYAIIFRRVAASE